MGYIHHSELKKRGMGLRLERGWGRTIYRKIKKIKCLVKEIFSEPRRNNRIQRGILTNALLGSSLSLTLSSYYSVVVYGDSTLPETGPPSRFFLAVRGKVKDFSQVFWTLIIFSLKSAHKVICFGASSP